MIRLDKNVIVIMAFLAMWAEAQDYDDAVESAQNVELYRLRAVSSIPLASSPLNKPTKFRRPTTTRRPFRKRPTTTQRPPPDEAAAPAPPDVPPVLSPEPQVPEPVPEEPPQVEVQPPVSDSQPPFDNSPYQPPSPPPAPPAVSTANQAVVQAPPGRPQRPLPTSKPHRPNGRPPVAVQPVFHPPVELTVPDEQPALVYSDSSTTADGGYSFEHGLSDFTNLCQLGTRQPDCEFHYFQVSNSVFRKEQGFMKRSLIWPGRLVHVKTGAYSFTSPEGTFHRIDFVADENGYRAYESH